MVSLDGGMLKNSMKLEKFQGRRNRETMPTVWQPAASLEIARLYLPPTKDTQEQKVNFSLKNTGEGEGYGKRKSNLNGIREYIA